MPNQSSIPPLSPELSRKKKIFDRGLIILSILSLILLIIVQRQLLNLGPSLSGNQGVITLVSINMSVFILGLLLFLILRGLYRVFFEQRNYGNLQTKMVVSFIGLSLMPTLMIFYFSYLLIGQDQETWFSSSIRDTLDDALALSEYTQSLDQELMKSKLETLIEKINPGLTENGTAGAVGAGAGVGAAGAGADAGNGGELTEARVSKILQEQRELLGLDLAEFYEPGGGLVAGSSGGEPAMPIEPLFFASMDWAANEAMVPYSIRGPKERHSDSNPDRLIAPLRGAKGLLGFLAISGHKRGDIGAQVELVRQGLAHYRLALGISRPFRVTQMTSLAGVTLLAVFLSIWIGSHLAGSLAGPVTELVEGTKKVAKGDLDYVLTPVHKSGEMAQLVQAFNQMTSELRESYTEIDRRRRFVETVLKQVSSGVLVTDLDHHLVDINQAARDMLGLEDLTLGQPEPEFILPLLGHPGTPVKNREHVFLEVLDKTLSLTLSRTKLKDEDGSEIGDLVTFDDISELEKAQRMAAWREVAKRIAHEIKNPLTPISLSAQRLMRRFGDQIAPGGDREIFEECTSVIVRQVENMRNLVDEFSQFARLPEINPKPANFVEVIEESLSLFRSAHSGLEFTLTVKKAPKTFAFDPEQIGRVVTNLLANSAAATNGHGKIDLVIDIDELAGVSLTVSDNGPGLKPEVRDRIFEPYVTSGHGEGKGLGLSIVNTIVRDHEGFIRVTDNPPRGTSFIVTIPYRSWS
ncbi:MAG: HAMP domain-containing protein [Deltaproteobacteria bacterium]|jgi:two-component system nitrogen regulation sensor histidine kinase NtrY|nr:HAMP domain-containing protein [Deltaproteobacteria bacterium]